MIDRALRAISGSTVWRHQGRDEFDQLRAHSEDLRQEREGNAQELRGEDTDVLSR